MTGPEHYREAESLLSAAAKWTADPRSDPDARPVTPNRDTLIAQAQVHATLALASAQALQPVAHFMGDDPAVTEWARVIGHQQVAAVAS